MSLLGASLTCAFLAVTLSALFGFLPFCYHSKFRKIYPDHPDHKALRRGNVLLSFLLNFGGGVLLANCFCHWLPEVRHGMQNMNGILNIKYS